MERHEKMAEAAKIRIRELANGKLEIEYPNGRQRTYFPSFDIDRGLKLLGEFCSLRDSKGRLISENYNVHGFNWFPTMVSEVFWHVINPYVQYEKLLAEIFSKGYIVSIENKGRFQDTYGIATGKDIHLIDHAAAGPMLKALVLLNNKLALLRKKELMLHTNIPGNFRTAYIEQHLKEMGIDYLPCLNVSIREVAKSLLCLGKSYFINLLPRKNMFGIKYRMDKFKDKALKNYMEIAVSYAERMMTKSCEEYELHLSLLKNGKLKKFLAIDDTNHYIYPVVYAFKKKGIRTIGYQHGVYSSRHIAYSMKGLSFRDYEWFDGIVVWGEYWKKKLAENKNVKSAIMIGANKHERPDYEGFRLEARKGNKKEKSAGKASSWAGRVRKLSILIPYEFLADTFHIGKYVTAFMEQGHEVYFKPRNDEELKGQLEAYGLSKANQERIKIAEKVDKTLLKKIDAIAGGQTTLLYELLPYGIPVFILDNDFRLVDDMADEGYASKLSLEQAGSIAKRLENFKAREAKPEYFFSKMGMNESLRKIMKL